MSHTLFPAEGEAKQLLVGSDSITWRFASDARLQVAMLHPLLLQVAHPTVAAGVRDYSDFERRPWDRLWRTLDYVTLLVYGGERALAAGRRLRTIHKTFRGVRDDGEPYTALEPRAYAWVHATLIATYVAGHARFGTPMRSDEIDRFYREYRGLGRLIGIRERDLPLDWKGFRAYFDHVAHTELRRTDSVERVLRIGGPQTGAPTAIPELVWRVARPPASRALWLGGVGLMSPALRRRLEIRWSRLDEVAFRGLGTLLRATTPVLPDWLRITGPAHLRWREAEIASGPLGAGVALPLA